MRIDEIIRVQEGFKQQKSQGKNKNISKEITEKTEFNVIEALMGKVNNKKGKGKNKTEMPPITQANPAYNLSLSGSSAPRTPMWDVFWTKREPAMSDDDFEKEISALALEFAEKSTEIANSGKGKAMINSMLDKLRNEYNDKRVNLELQYVSVVSPDRKAAYAKTDFTKGNVVYGNDGNGLLEWVPSGWATFPTAAEKERFYKFADIYRETLTAYEKEHGQIPYSTISKTAAPQKNWV
jgi:hypothetical protein